MHEQQRIACRLLVALALGVPLGGARAAVRAPEEGKAARGQVTATASGYHLLRTYKLGGEGFWDYLYLDAAARRLYVSHATHVVVMNADDGTVAGDIPNTNGVHGVAIAPELGRGYTSNGRDTTVTVFDTKTLKVLRTIKVTGAGPDAIVYDPASRRVFTCNGRGANATAIDAARDSVVGTLALGGKPEFAVTDNEGRLYVNVEDTAEIVAIDTRKLTILARWSLAPGEGPSGLAIDREHQRLFAVCENEKMVVLDAGTGKVVATPPIGKGTDGVRFDPGTGLAFSSNGEGTLTVVHQDDPDHYRVVDTVATQRGARTLELDPATHAVYLSAASFGPAPAPTAENPRPRPAIVPGSFVVLVFGR
jgi:YVTN family beta-propeller protein